MTGVSKTEVTVKVKSPRDETITIPANEVLNIAWSGEPPEANLARSDEAAGRFQKASTATRSRRRVRKRPTRWRDWNSTTPSPAPRASWHWAIPKRPTKRSGNSKNFVQSWPTITAITSWYNCWVSCIWRAKKVSKAQAAFDALSHRAWPDAKMTAKMSVARLLADDDRPDEALAAFDAVVAMTGGTAHEESLRQEAAWENREFWSPREISQRRRNCWLT